MTNNHDNYQYPLNDSWTTAEIITVTQFYGLVERANEQRVVTADFLAAYRAFKQVVPAKSEEKQLGRAFESASGYSIYRTVQAAQQATRQQFQYRG